jgi:hypothetical protein
MSLTEDLKAYITKNAKPGTDITEKHDAVIVGEVHARLRSEEPNIRTKAVVRLLLELLEDSRYRYFANESYLNAGAVRASVRSYLRDKSLPPAFDSKDKSLDEAEIARRVLPRRYQPVLDFLRAHPRYVLPIGSPIEEGAARDARLAQHLFEEIADRKLTKSTPGIVLLGTLHAAAAPDNGWPTTRILMDRRGYSCVSIRVITDFEPPDVPADDVVVQLGADLDNLQPSDMIRLTSLVDKTPVTIPTAADGQDSPLRKVTFGFSNHSVADQFQYLVLHKA